MKKLHRNLIYLSTLFFIIILSKGCGEESLTPTGEDISGIVTFTDTNLITTGGYYAVSVYADQNLPFDTNPIRSDSLAITRSGNIYSSYYRIGGLAAGRYYIGTSWIRRPYIQSLLTPALGTYGCDTNHSCSAHIRIEFPSFAGTGNVNFLSWTDTLKKLN
ncbi:MAG: hypothetical protein ACRDFC_02790 [Ignavibacteria bacterium]